MDETQQGETLDGTALPSGTARAPARASPDPLSASRIGRYAILRRLGAGGMGVVFAAYDEQLDRKVAIKLLHRREGDSRLLREAQGLARLSHPNVVQIYEIGEHEGAVFMAMEFIAGVTLKGQGGAFMLRIATRSGQDAVLAKARSTEPRRFGNPASAMILLREVGIAVARSCSKVMLCIGFTASEMESLCTVDRSRATTAGRSARFNESAEGPGHEDDEVPGQAIAGGSSAHLVCFWRDCRQNS